ncbi:MAG: hypothetical protein ACI81L_003078 [Verrucomicrobiales bacterium]|jgi:hypothetical protein
MAITPDPQNETGDGRLPLLTAPTSWRVLLLAILLVAIVAETTARLIEQTNPSTIEWYDAQAALRVQMFESQGPTNIVFAGTSMPWQAFVPATFTDVDAEDRSAFNVGLAGAVPTVTEPWLLDHVEPKLSPSMVVWGLSSLDLAPNFGSAQLEAWRNAPASRSGWLSDLDQSARSASAFIRMRPLLRRPSNLVGDGADSIRRQIVDAARNTGASGERLGFDPNQTDREAAILRARLADFVPDQDDVDAIARTVAELRRRDVEVIFVQMPVPPALRPLHPRGEEDFAAAVQRIDSLGVELGVDVLHFEDVFVDDDFVDFTHLDEDAAQRFTTWFTQALALDDAPIGSCTELQIVDGLGFRLPITRCRN